MKRLFQSILILLVLIFGFAACKRSGEVKIENRISKTIISNVYWGDNYIGGNLHPGESTEFIRIDQSQEKLPAAFRIYFEVESKEQLTFYTERKYTLDKNNQLLITLGDTTAFYELED